jgi:uncharacterized FlaG/YvyC family protein
MEEENDSIGRVGAIGSTELPSAYDSSAGAASRATAVGTVLAASRKPPRQPTTQDIEAAIRQANENLVSVNRVLEFNTDRASGLTVATIRNSQTGEVLQQFPGPDILHLAQMLAAWSPGRNILLDLLA